MNETQEESLIHDPNNFEQPLHQVGDRVECKPTPASADARFDRLQFRLNVMEADYVKQQNKINRLEEELFDTRLFAAIDVTASQRVINIFTMGDPISVTDTADVDWPRYAGEAALVMGLITFVSYLKSILPKKTEESVIIRDGIIRIDGPQAEDETTTVVHTFGGKP